MAGREAVRGRALDSTVARTPPDSQRTAPRGGSDIRVAHSRCGGESQVTMRRIQLFEFEDQRWLPWWVRDAITAHLAHVFLSQAVEPLHEAMAEQIAGLLTRSGAAHIVDLCSGSGGPLPAVLPLVSKKRGCVVTATFTDLYPNRHLSDPDVENPDWMTVERRPVDARSAPLEAVGVRTMFNAIHHFPPEDVAEILRNATRFGRAVAIFEPFERRHRLALKLAAGGLRGGWRDARNYRGPVVRAAALHLLLPVALSWDGAVSVLRSYKTSELLAIAEGACVSAEFDWQAQQLRLPWGALTLLTGEPRAGSTTCG